MPAEKSGRCPGCGAVKTFSGQACSSVCARRAAQNKPPLIDEQLEKAVKLLFDRSVKNAKGGRLSLEYVCRKLDRSPDRVNLAVESLFNQGHNVTIDGDSFKLSPEVPVSSRREAVVIRHSLDNYKGGWRKFGACGDFHFGSLHERLDVVNTLYDLYEKEGVSEVYHTGNWIEGEARFNYSDIHIFGLDDQIDYALKVWPRKKGIKTFYVAGDDHEGWWQQKTRLRIGQHLQRKAREIGREDLVYLGYMEGHVELKASEGSAHMMVMHPGGGAAYAESYAAQKIAEAFQEGEKPDVCLVGHYHKMIYGLHRGIHMLQTGTGQDQSMFMRKQRIKAAVGGCLVELHQAPAGHINRFKPEFFTFYDRRFYGPNKRKFLS
jgi:hypothetical protein